MNDEMEVAIEKIKLQEQENDAKLKEKRAIEATLASLNRNLKETLLNIHKLKEELAETTAKADTANAGLITAQALHSALTGQLEASANQLQQLKNESEQGVSKVWEMRNMLYDEVHKVSDQCDMWALFTKPKHIELTNTKLKKTLNDNSKNLPQQISLLESVQKRRQSLIVERDRLLNEPEFGEEFKRIKNALRYSTEMVAQNMRE